MKWQDKLNKKQRTHVRESIDGRITLAKVINNCKAQEDRMFPCWECVNIAHRLGVNLELREFNQRIA